MLSVEEIYLFKINGDDDDYESMNNETMKHIQFCIIAVEKRIISKYKCTGFGRKFINQKRFGQGIGATNAQNRVK